MSDEEESDEEDYPEVGDIRNGLILACMGDDRPERWIGWLGSLVDDFDELQTLAEQHDLSMDAGRKYGVLKGWSEFCEALGVSIDTEFWEGCMNSGQFVTGWINVKKVARAQKTGKAILEQIRSRLLKEIRRAVMAELKEIEDVDLLADYTWRGHYQLTEQIAGLTEQIAGLKSSLTATQTTASALDKALKEARENDTSALTLDCLRIACAVLNYDRQILLAGPVVLWSDGIVYAFTSRGGVPLPGDSAPSLLLEELKRAGHAVVEVGEETVVRGYMNPRRLTGTPHISGWLNLWRQVESSARRFVVADPGQLAVVRDIHNHFKTPPPDANSPS